MDDNNQTQPVGDQGGQPGIQTPPPSEGTDVPPAEAPVVPSIPEPTQPEPTTEVPPAEEPQAPEAPGTDTNQGGQGSTGV